MSRRCFIGVPLPRHIRTTLTDVRDSIQHIGSQRTVSPDQYHITLAFLGDVRDNQVSDIQDRLNDIDMSAFDVTLRGIGFFPGNDHIRVVWAGVESTDKQLTALAESVRALLPDTYEEDREFHPHITLSRVKHMTTEEREALQEKQRTLNSSLGSFTVDRFILYESRLTDSGPEYKGIASYQIP